jgi:hypothetical protein
MTFDEQLKGAFDTLTDRLREEIGRQVQSVVDELAASAQSDRAQAIADARDAAERDASDRVAAAVASAEARARDQGHETARADAGRSSDGAVSERLVDAVRSMSRARSLSEVLDTLVGCAGREAPRAGVLLVRGGRFRGWRFIGFGPALDDSHSGQSLELSSDEAGVVAEAVRTNAPVNNVNASPSFAALPPGRKSLAMPIALAGQVVAVLYADQGFGSELATEKSELGTSNPEHGTTNPEPGTRNPEPSVVWHDTLEVLARHAARCLEALTAFKAARALMERPDSLQSTAPAASEGALADEDASARRYARLLISEIKLYHEAAVVEGRRDRDLGERLGGEIARARVLYEQRVPPHVSLRADYFHDELVRTLANGDASLLEVRT